MVEFTTIVAGIALIILWVWPQERPDDPYDDPDHWGQQ